MKAPTQRAVDAVQDALEKAQGSRQPLEVVARKAVMAAWPHLRGESHDFNDLERIRTLQQALTARTEELNQARQSSVLEGRDIFDWAALADQLAEALAFVCDDPSSPFPPSAREALASYDELRKGAIVDE